MSEAQDPNPYAPPAASLDVDPGAGAAYDDLASRWQRLGGSLFDGLLALIASIPLFFGMPFDQVLRVNSQSANPFAVYMMSGWWGMVAGALLVALTIVQWTLLATRGQTIGKIVAGTRVVGIDDARVGFLRAVALRVWPGEIISRAHVPLLPLLLFIDVLVIFGASRRCVHDRIAGTKVIRVQP